MSFVLAAPEALVTAASDLAGIGSSLGTASAAAAAPTTGVLAAAADQVSTQVAALLSEHGVGYQQLSAGLSAFHEQFVQTLSAGANTYAAAEANAAQTLVNAVNAPAEAVLGQPLIGGGGAVGSVFSNAVNRIESAALGGSGVAGLLGSGSGLLDGGRALASAAGALLAPAAVTNAAVAPAALTAGSIGAAIEGAYLTIEPWVQYGFNLAAWALGYVPLVGVLAPQINFLYYLFEPIVQSVLFNTIDFLDGAVSLSQGLNNIWASTTASINQFINTEINWVHGFLPPLPPVTP
ncbi:PE family protein [Mycobacterium malmoense]|uniref:PE family protein n=1 Tax=Mycobacterium malmoense TaxID=1780 RepID=A0ABX3STE5_MYCMA|nr:PE family protein [Mycobacterium malmoense]ORA82073.1 PE family protein [Mycobacterium malmoense]QZA16616.1 PE family protein [Mycobacterium malmoense]UNB93417.1 PE family protein [Mycobacterium malmoense]